MKQSSYLAGVLLLATLPAFSAGTDHLVMSEVAVRGGLYVNGHTSSEFVEVYNPTASPITDIQNYYLTDWSNYFTLPGATRDGALPDLGTGDYLLKFPASAAPIPSGGLAVVTAHGTTFLEAYFGGSLAAFQSQPGAPQLFECFDSDPAIPNMDNLNQEDTDGRFNLSQTDAGEQNFLFYWDGTSDVVKDVDIMMYGRVGADLGTGNGYLPKSGYGSDGPDADSDNTNYANDNGMNSNLTARYAGYAITTNPFQYFRRSLVEIGEATTGGNGLTGHDETLENINVTWGGAYETSATATPGVTQLGLSADNQPPVIYEVSATPFAVQAGENIQFQARIADDASIASAVVKVDTGSGFTDVAMTNSGPDNIWTGSLTAPANGSRIKWYISATDNGGLTSTSNDFHFSDSNFPGYLSLPVGFDPSKLQITEIHYDPIGSDNHGDSEFIELHNFSESPMDISGFLVSRNEPDFANFARFIPEGTIVPAGGYVVLAAWGPVFNLVYPGFDPDQLVDLAWERDSSLANSTDSIFITHPLHIGTNDQPSLPFEAFTYTGMAAGTFAGNNGYTFELTDVDGPNENQASWGVSLSLGGTPGRRNTLDNPDSVSITNQGRTVQYPGAATPIIINADITGTGITAVNLHYTSAPGVNYSSTPMTVVSGSQYSANLGTFALGTIIKYYIEVVTANSKVTYPPAGIPIIFHIDDTPPTDQDLVINEIMSDPSGTENVDNSEFIEIYNRTASPIDVSFFKVGHIVEANPYPRVLPEGTVIPANGYFVFAGSQALILEDHPALDPALVFDALYVGAIIANGSGTGFITHANATNWNELTWQNPGTPFDTVPYEEAANGWPDTTNDISRELTNPALDNAVGSNWAATTVTGGTPGAINSTFNSSVNNWTLY